jgi:hypothetical protein
MGEEKRIQTFVDSVKTVIANEFPDLVGRYRYLVKAKVLKIYLEGYADLQVYDAEGKPDQLVPPFPKVPVPNSLSQQLQQGSFVRVGFYYNDPTQPFIDGEV